MLALSIPHQNDNEIPPKRITKLEFTADTMNDENLLAVMFKFVGQGGHLSIKGMDFEFSADMIGKYIETK